MDLHILTDARHEAYNNTYFPLGFKVKRIALVAVMLVEDENKKGHVAEH